MLTIKVKVRNRLFKKNRQGLKIKQSIMHKSKRKKKSNLRRKIVNQHNPNNHKARNKFKAPKS